MNLNPLNSSEYKRPHLWLAASVVIVVAAMVAAGLLMYKAGSLKLPVNTTGNIGTSSAVPTPQTATASAKQASNDLKAVDLAALKTSINEIKSVLASF